MLFGKKRTIIYYKQQFLFLILYNVHCTYMDKGPGIWIGLKNSDTLRCYCSPLGITAWNPCHGPPALTIWPKCLMLAWMILTSPHLPPVLTSTIIPGWCAALTACRAISGVMTTLLPSATRARDWSTPPTLACAATPWSGEMCPAANTLMIRESTATGSGALVRTCSVSTLGTQVIKEMEQPLRRGHTLSKLTLRN